MEIDNRLEKYDPSRYTVYQMLDYTKNIQKIKLIQKFSEDIYLFRTKPFVNTLYNHANVMKKSLLERELVEIKNFFGKDTFRIKIPENEKLKEFLFYQGLKFEDVGSIMVNENIHKKEHNYSLVENLEIFPVNNKKTLEDYKSIFSEAFDCSLEDTNKKFGFLDKIILDSKNNHMNAFVLYENNTPVSTGAYYAFDNFSIENIGTRKAFRGKGYAYNIMNHLLKEAQKLKYNQACLVASEAGSRVYKKVGFKILTKTNTFTPN
ncbi:MAG: GNAT family N-acetyltransferase [Nanoarchaeota archaeon]